MKKNILFILLFFSLKILAQPIPYYVPTDSLKLWMPFSGNKNDLSGNNHNGLIDSAITLTTDRCNKPNSAYYFNGNNSMIIIPDTFFNINWNQYTVSFWFQSDSNINPFNSSDNQSMINTIPHNGFEVCLNWGNLSNKYNIFIGSNPPISGWDISGLGNFMSSTNVVIHQWQQIVYIKNGLNFSVYINGVFNNNYSTTTAIQSKFCKLIIGNIDTIHNHEGFWGKLDDYGIWNRALTPAEVLALYHWDCSDKTIDLCANGSYTLSNGTVISTPGIYKDTFLNANGIDSIVTVTTIGGTPKYSTLNITKCPLQTYMLPNGNNVTAAGTYKDTIITLGCDSIITINITNSPYINKVINASKCPTQNYILPNGLTVTAAGVYKDTFLLSTGCDSIITINLTNYPVYNNTINASICNNQTYTLPNGNAVTAAGTYTNHLQSIHFCDSTIITNLTVKQISTHSISTSICSNQTYTLPNGSVVNIAGNYTNTLLNSVGCDSIIYIQLSVKTANTNTLNIVKCAGEAYTMPNGNIVTADGVYTNKFTNVVGCDSIITINFSHYNNNIILHYDTICSTQTFTLPSKKIVNTTGIYIDTFKNQLGCDSIIETNLWVVNLPLFSLGNDTTICYDEPLLLKQNFSNATYLWNDASTNNFKLVTDSGIYILKITLSPCPSTSDTINIKSKNCSCTIYIPNVFTPNADGINDLFQPIFNCTYPLQNYQIKIFNRWGEMVFTSQNINNSWNGEYLNSLCDEGTYMYLITYKNTKTNQSEVIKGDILLIK